jgi:hypothetical protein
LNDILNIKSLSSSNPSELSHNLLDFFHVYVAASIGSFTSHFDLDTHPIFILFQQLLNTPTNHGFLPINFVLILLGIHLQTGKSDLSFDQIQVLIAIFLIYSSNPQLTPILIYLFFNLLHILQDICFLPEIFILPWYSLKDFQIDFLNFNLARSPKSRFFCERFVKRFFRNLVTFIS